MKLAASGHGGFILLEMLVVLAVLGLLAGLVLGCGPPRSAALEMRAAVTVVAQGLRAACGQAITANRPVTVLFDTRARTMRVGTAAIQALPVAVAVDGGAGSPGLRSCRTAAPRAAESISRRVSAECRSAWTGLPAGSAWPAVYPDAGHGNPAVRYRPGDWNNCRAAPMTRPR